MTRIILFCLITTFLGINHAPPAFAVWETGARVGIGNERLDWNIAGTTKTPNILSELTFQRTPTKLALLEGRYREDRWSVGGEFQYGLLGKGAVRDDDFNLDNRQGLFSRSQNTIDGNSLFGAAINADYKLLKTDWGSLGGMAGARIFQDTFRITQGIQVVPATGPFNNLNSSYRARWYGFELGLTGDLRIWTTPVWLRGTATWMPWLRYQGQGTWNLRTDLAQTPSFKHNADGSGYRTDVGTFYKFSKNGEAGLGWRWTWMEASNGTTTTYSKTGNPSSGILNAVHSMSNFYYLSLNWKW